MRLLAFATVLSLSCHAEPDYPKVRGNRHYPMVVWVSPKFSQATRGALAMAAAEFPCRMFIFEDDIRIADVTIEPDMGQAHCYGTVPYKFNHNGATGEDSPVGEYVHCDRGPSTIIVHKDFEDFDEAARYIIFTHELGHAAGLDHDDQTAEDPGKFKSIMEPQALNHLFFFRDGKINPRFMKDDLHTLVENYCL